MRNLPTRLCNQMHVTQLDIWLLPGCITYEAQLPGCANSWSESYLVVRVPWWCNWIVPLNSLLLSMGEVELIYIPKLPLYLHSSKIVSCSHTLILARVMLCGKNIFWLCNGMTCCIMRQQLGYIYTSYL